MTAPTLDVFLRARLDDDERVALAAPRYNWTIYLAGDPETGEYTEQRVLDHVIRHDPARVLREVEAKRHILDAYERAVDAGDRGLYTQWEQAQVDALRPLVELLALPYSDHPDYRAEWTP